jgi:type VI secretion system protein ImpL
MRITKLHLFTALGLLVWIVLAWLMGTWLKLAGTDLWLLRGALILIGVVGAVGFLWLRHREEGGAPASGQGSSEVDGAFREADARLQSPALRAEGKVSHLSCLLIVGDERSAKTSIAVHSGLEPELVAGQVFRDRDIIPTRGVNIWYARKNVLVEAGGQLLSDEANRGRLIRRLIPARLGSMFGRSAQAPRAVLLCVDCESLLKSGGAEASAVASRQFNAWLTDLSHRLGARLPVYVLFTKMDRIQHFQEYVGSLTGDEAAQVLGATLPLQNVTESGIYREAETARLSLEFDLLYQSLCDRRTDYLAREHNAERLPSVYEFPREFRKLRSVAVEFLVDVCRPSHLRAGPILRGFYFTGVRPIVVADVAVEPQAPAPPRGADLGATRVFVTGSLNPPAMSASREAQSRRVPQWVFLNHLFSDVILKDQAAQRSSSTSLTVSTGRRVLLAAATAVALVFAIGWTMSWLNNRAIVREAVDTAQVLPVLDPAQPPAASTQDLEKLDRQRLVLQKLTGWERNGAPMSMRWGLYEGHNLYAGAYKAYFETFRRMLLRPTQDTLTRFMSRPASAELQGYRPVYDALKAYLITTSNPDKSTQDFLVPVLMEHWQSRNQANQGDEDRATLVRRQFSFYASELPFQNPFPGTNPDQGAVGSARAYLARFAATEALYSAMVSAAGAAKPAFDFNKAYPGSADVVANTYIVPGAFTRDGFSFMQNAIQRPDDYFQGEAWVLGPQTIGSVDRANLQRDLQGKYRADFLRYWREFLQRTSVIRFGSVADAASKLNKLSSNQSPLLAALCAVSRNTSVDDPEIVKAFQSAQQVEPAACSERLAAPGNAAYVSGLIQLQSALQQLAQNKNDTAAQSQAASAASAALVTVRQMASQFPVDREGGVSAKTQSLLEDPIKSAQAWVVGVPKEDVNSGAQGFCKQYRTLISKYPFDPKASARATQGEFDAIFKPGDGALWKLYMSTLNKFLTKQGAEYVATPGGGMTPTPQFLSFFNRAAAVSDAFYKGGSQTANLNFSLRPVPSEAVVQEITLTINGKTASFKNGKGDAQPFSWPGAGAQEVKLKVRFTGGSEFDMITYSEPWAVFRFFLDAEHWQASGNQNTMEWTARSTTGPMIIGGKPATVRFTLDLGGAPAIFQPGFWSASACPGPAVK